jgi:hypothetical protein
MGQRARLTQHRVDERRLAMVDVGDDGYVTKVRARIHTKIVAAQVCIRENDGRAARNQVKSSKFAGFTPKKKCCRSKPRCKRCPVVLQKVRKAELSGVRGKELEKVFKRTRKS